MQISPNELFSPLVGVILFFTEQDVIDRSSYMVYNSVEAANLADCMSSKIDNSFILNQSKWYKSDEYGVLQNITTRTQGAGTDVNKEAMDQSGSTSSETNNQPKLKYVQIDMPISKVLYQTITDSSFSSSQLLTPDELSKIIMSNLFSVLDNRLTIIRVIVEHLYKEKQIYRRMYHDYIAKGYNILISINGFDMSENLYMSLINMESGNMILMQMLNGIKIKDDLVQHDAICKANLYLTSWERSFANLLREVKKSMMFQITDSQNQKAYASSDSTSLQIGISISVEDLNICYMFNKLSMNSRFLQSNKQLLKKQFDSADIRPRLVLEVAFDENEIVDQETELTVDKFINSDYFTNVALHFHNLNIELKVAEIGNTEYSMCLDNCGLKLFKSLPARLTRLEMKNMHLTESIQIPHTFDTFVCRDVLVDEGCEIILNRSNLKIELVGVQGRIRHDFGVIVSQASSTIICTRISNKRIELLKMVDICCQSKFICSNEIESLELIKAEMSGGRAIFSGNCKKILVVSCSNAFNFKTMRSVDTLRIAGNLSKDFFDNLPITIQTLIIKDAKMNFNAIFQKELICLRLENIQVKPQCKFEMTNECKSITITRSTGVFNLFERMNLIFDNQQDNLQEFILEKHDEDNLLDIRVAYAKMDAKNVVVENLKSITLKNVEIVEPLFLYIDNRLKKLEIHETTGKFEMNGIVTGTFKNVEETRLGILSIVNIANPNRYTIKIEKSMLLVAMSITCNLEHLKLDDITADKNFKVSVKGTCYHTELKKYTGSLEMLDIPRLKRMSFVRADVDYNMVTQHFSLDGKLHEQGCQVPRNINSLKLENLVMSNQRIPDRHINLEQINIKRCVGVFNFVGLLNIKDLDLKLKSVVEMKNITTIDAEVNLSHISFNQSLNFPNNISKLILTHVNFANGTNVEVSL
ncbi:putative LRR containing protein [Trachipleistophora hominis]|uniref:Putative LRR containing protein n=1 Tax=Trachipleistophora hominis TaxID=72359 RepID=L7JTU5_TRAHO|nr:putative LRR containing protein [Trachipleistophora hominis]